VLEHHPTARLEIVGPLGAAPREFILDRMDDPKALALHPLFEGDYPASLQKALSPSVAERVSFVGPVPYREMAVRYGRAHLLVCPSVWNEPFGLPVVEAMACGLPVVATRSGGIQDIVRHEETGLLVERGNVEELAEAMTGLLADPTRRESMGRAGRARAVEQYSWDRVVRELAEYYGDLLRAN
jgi:glycosyltransferase involved in cell wall biosynthesis